MSDLDALAQELERLAAQLRSGELAGRRGRRRSRALRRAGRPAGRRARQRGARGRARRPGGPGTPAVSASAQEATYPTELQEEVEDYLETLAFTDEAGIAGLVEAMRYSLLGGGKRIRPVLALATGKALGRDTRELLPAGGRAGDGPHLLADPRRPAGHGRRRPAPRPAHLPRGLRRGRGHPRRRRPVRRGASPAAARPARVAPAGAGRRRSSWSTATGTEGMVGGQYVDVSAPDDLDPDALRRLHELKTGRLIAASVGCALSLVGEEGSATIALRRFAAELGVLFQIVDDILDVTGDEAELGKPQGSDERHGKRTYVSVFGLDEARRLADESHAKARECLCRGRRTDHRARANLRLHPHPPDVTTLLDQIDGPDDLKGLDDDQLQQVAQEVRELIIDTIGEIGGHFGANLGTCELSVALHSLLDSPTDKVLWDVGPPGLPAQGPHRPPGPPGHHPQVRRPRALLLDPRVRARHHGRRPRLDLGVLRRGPQGGHAPGRGRGRQGRRGDRRRRSDRRRGLRGAAQRGRHGPADRDRAQRQRDVDRAQRRRALAPVHPRAAEPQAAPRARGGGGGADQAARRHRPAHRAPGPGPQGVAEGLLGAGAVLRGAQPGLRRDGRRPRRRRPARGHRRGARRPAAGGRPHQHRQGQGLRARRGRRPGGHGEVARRQGQRHPQPRARPQEVRGAQGAGRARSTRRSSATRWSRSASATSGWWASPPP